MQISFKKLAEIHAALSAFYGLALPPKAAYAIGKNLHRTRSIVAPVEVDMSNERQKRQVKNADGEPVMGYWRGDILVAKDIDPSLPAPAGLDIGFVFSDEDQRFFQAYIARVNEEMHDVEFHSVSFADFTGKSDVPPGAMSVLIENGILID